MADAAAPAHAVDAVNSADATSVFRAALAEWTESKGKALDRIALRNLSEVESTLSWLSNSGNGGELKLAHHLNASAAPEVVTFTCNITKATASTTTRFTASLSGSNMINLECTREVSDGSGTTGAGGDVQESDGAPGANTTCSLKETRCQVDNVAIEALRNKVAPNVEQPDFLELLSGVPLQLLGAPPVVRTFLLEQELGRLMDAQSDDDSDADVAAARIGLSAAATAAAGDASGDEPVTTSLRGAGGEGRGRGGRGGGGRGKGKSGGRAKRAKTGDT
ncbi:hypothetical protein JKP88DRAFT_253098 [Tribonema minus]|uniref:Uncharacterized protein n=1 Tax=Tribonema minus TaxID=303371 RepID=A0A835ZAT2_9STRA|nr:hypothetical protein JKP88DRAFT_253098 [Tribonema minus]